MEANPPPLVGPQPLVSISLASARDRDPDTPVEDSCIKVNAYIAINQRNAKIKSQADIISDATEYISAQLTKLFIFNT